jgi:hypothetical protein
VQPGRLRGEEGSGEGHVTVARGGTIYLLVSFPCTAGTTAPAPTTTDPPEDPPTTTTTEAPA